MAATTSGLFSIITVLQVVHVLPTSGKHHPLSDEFINMINFKQNFWRAGRNFHEDKPLSYIDSLMGVLKDENPINVPRFKHDDESVILNSLNTLMQETNGLTARHK